MKRRAEDLRREFQKDCAIEDVMCSDANAAESLEKIFAPVLFPRKTAYIFLNIFSSDSFLRAVEARLPAFAKDAANHFVFIQEGAPGSESRTAADFLRARGREEIFPRLSPRDVGIWAKKEVERLGGSIGPAAVFELVSRSSGDMWRLSQEIQKLTAFAFGKEISREDVLLFVREDADPDIFKMLDAAAGGMKNEALAMAARRLANGEAPLYLFSRISGQARLMMLVKDAQDRGVPSSKIAGLLSLHPFAAKKAQAACARVSSSALRELYKKVFSLDIALKTGKGDPEHLLYLFAGQIAGMR